MTKSQKILLSAYACEPHKGSEPGVGWHWAIELTKLGHEVWVVTRKNNQPVIETALTQSPIPNINFIYYDLPIWALWWKKGRRGIHLYYFLWQWGAYQAVKKIHHRERFDRVHHVTLVSVRQPSFMGRLNIPFTFGPVAGGESVPKPLRRSFSREAQIYELLRDLSNFLPRFDPLLRLTYRSAEKIYVTSDQTRVLLPKKFHPKTNVKLAIGWSGSQIIQNDIKLVPRAENDTVRVLFVGHFLPLKGGHLGLQAFANLAQRYPAARLTLVGRGPSEANWRSMTQDLGIADQTVWIPWVNQAELSEIYAQHDVFLFPSLRDSGGMVVLEALAHGLPTICLDLGGPGVIVDSTCGRKIRTAGRHEKEIIVALTAALMELSGNGDLNATLRQGACKRAERYLWQIVVGDHYL